MIYSFCYYQYNKLKYLNIVLMETLFSEYYWVKVLAKLANQADNLWEIKFNQALAENNKVVNSLEFLKVVNKKRRKFFRDFRRETPYGQ